MTNLIKIAGEQYSDLAMSSSDAPTRVGRPGADEVTEAAIWEDINRKLQPKAGNSILEIGAGCGYIAKQWMIAANALGLNMVFVDFPKVIDRLCTEFQNDDLLNSGCCEYFKGEFPFDVYNELAHRRFNRICLYSVIHYSNDPENLIDKSVNLLAPGGRLLVGDIPNLSKKARFITSGFGKFFDAQYKGVKIEQLPEYSSRDEFVKKMIESGAPPIDDAFQMNVVNKYRKSGFDVYLLEQPDGTLMNHTREDIVICAPYD